MIRRITLIEPKNDHLHIFSKFELPRLGSILLATIMRDTGYEAEALFMRDREILARGARNRPRRHFHDHCHRHQRLRHCRRISGAGIPVVFGGPHASFLPEEALEHGDYCIIGRRGNGLPAPRGGAERQAALSRGARAGRGGKAA